MRSCLSVPPLWSRRGHRPRYAPTSEPLRVANLQDEAKGGERAHAGNLLEALRGGIIFFAPLHEVAFHRLDLFGDVGEHGEQGLNHWQTIGGHIGQHRLVERFTGGVAHGMAEALEGEADGVDEVDARAHQSIAQFQTQQIMLGLSRAVLDGMKQGRVNPRQPGEHLGVAPVALAFGARDGVELARVGDEDRGPVFGEVTTDPRAVGAGLQRDGGAGEVHEQLCQRRPGVGQRRFADNLAGGIQDADVMRAITKIKAEGEPADEGSGRCGNFSRSSFIFHRQIISLNASLRRASAFSSNLVRRHGHNLPSLIGYPLSRLLEGNHILIA